MALTPEEKKRLQLMLLEAQEEAEKSNIIEDPLSAREALETFQTALGQSAGFNLVDEAVALKEGTTDEERIAANELIEEQRNKNVLNALAGLAGDVVGSVPAGAFAASRLLKPGATVLKVAGEKAVPVLSALGGAVSGAGAGEGVEGRATGALLGGTLGVLIPKAGEAAKKVAAKSSDAVMSAAIKDLEKESVETALEKTGFKAGLVAAPDKETEEILQKHRIKQQEWTKRAEERYPDLGFFDRNAEYSKIEPPPALPPEPPQPPIAPRTPPPLPEKPTVKRGPEWGKYKKDKDAVEELRRQYDIDYKKYIEDSRTYDDRLKKWKEENDPDFVPTPARPPVVIEQPQPTNRPRELTKEEIKEINRQRREERARNRQNQGNLLIDEGVDDVVEGRAAQLILERMGFPASDVTPGGVMRTTNITPTDAIRATEEKPKLVIIQGGNEPKPKGANEGDKEIRKNIFDIIDEEEKGIPIEDKPVLDNELIKPDADKLLTMGSMDGVTQRFAVQSPIENRLEKIFADLFQLENNELEALNKVVSKKLEYRPALDIAGNEVMIASPASGGGGGGPKNPAAAIPVREPKVLAPTVQIDLAIQKTSDTVKTAAEELRQYLATNKIRPFRHLDALLSNFNKSADPDLNAFRDALTKAREFDYDMKKDTLLEAYDEKAYKLTKMSPSQPVKKPLIEIDAEAGILTISDRDNNAFRGQGVIDEEGTLHLVIKTKDVSKKPDAKSGRFKVLGESAILNADDLLEQILWFFGPEVKSVKGVWMASDQEIGFTALGHNNRMYNRAYMALKDTYPEKEAQKLAARMTWTAKKLREYGYTVPKITRIKKGGTDPTEPFDQVEVRFMKP